MTAADPVPPRRLICSASVFEAAYGYSRAVLDGDWVFVAGTTGFDYSAMSILCCGGPARSWRRSARQRPR